MILYNKRITKALIRLRGCAGWSAPLLFANHGRQVFSRRGPFSKVAYVLCFDSSIFTWHTKLLVRPASNFCPRTRVDIFDIITSRKWNSILNIQIIVIQEHATNAPLECYMLSYINMKARDHNFTIFKLRYNHYGLCSMEFDLVRWYSTTLIVHPMTFKYHMVCTPSRMAAHSCLIFPCWRIALRWYNVITLKGTNLEIFDN